jgi:hypothetical protein
MGLHQLQPFIVPLIVVVILGRRLMNNKPRKVKTKRIFLFPALIVLATALTLWAAPLPTPWLLWIPIDLAALIAGLVVGFLSAHHQEFAIDYDTGTITSKATPFGTILVFALFALKFGLRLVLPQIDGSPFQASSYIPDSPIPHAAHHGPATIMGFTDAGIIFSAAMMVARAATTYFRALPLIAAHKEHLESKAASANPAP